MVKVQGASEPRRCCANSPFCRSANAFMRRTTWPRRDAQEPSESNPKAFAPKPRPEPAPGRGFCLLVHRVTVRPGAIPWPHGKPVAQCHAQPLPGRQSGELLRLRRWRPGTFGRVLALRSWSTRTRSSRVPAHGGQRAPPPEAQVWSRVTGVRALRAYSERTSRTTSSKTSARRRSAFHPVSWRTLLTSGTRLAMSSKPASYATS